MTLSASAAETAPARQRVLFFTKSSGFEHDAIKQVMTDGRPGFAFPVLDEIGRKHNLDVVFSKDAWRFSAEYLAQFDAFIFYTTGDLTMARSEPRGDGLPPMTAEGKAALLAAVAGGKGFVGVHSCSDTFHSQGLHEHGPGR
jgi:hypothetical protein